MKELYTKLYIIQKEGLNIAKNATADVGKFSYDYLTLDKLMEVLRPILEKHKLLVFHQMIAGEMITRLVDTENPEQIVSSCFPIQKEIEPQKVGSAITYGKRYNISQIFNILTDADDDGAKASTKPKTAHQEAHHEVSAQKTTGTPTCSNCKIDAVPNRSGNGMHCPKFKSHPQGAYIPLIYPNAPVKDIDEDDDAVQKFNEAMDNEVPF